MTMLLYAALKSNLYFFVRIVSVRDGVNVFVGYNRDGGAVAAKQYIRPSQLTLPQILGTVNRSNLVKMLVCHYW